MSADGSRTAADGAILRPWRPGDEQGLVRLYAEVFDRSMSPAHWLWKFRGQGSPVEGVHVVEQDGELVAQAAAMPLLMRILGEERWAMVAVDMMVHPDHRARGLVNRLAEVAFPAWIRAQVPFVFGVPNQQYGQVLDQINATPWFALERRSLPLVPGALLRRRTGGFVGRPWRAALGALGPRDRSVRCRIPDSPREIAAELDRVADHVADAALFAPVRGAQRAIWKYADAPDGRGFVVLAERRGEPVGWAGCVLRERSDGLLRGAIAELAVRPDDPGARAVLLRRALAGLARQGAHIAQITAPEGDPGWDVQVRAGFRVRRPDLGVQLVQLDRKLDKERLRDPASWSLGSGDFDDV